MTKNITEHYKKYGVIKGDKLLLETAKNNYQKGKDESSLDIAELKARITILTQGCRIICEKEKAELIEKIRDKLKKELIDNEFATEHDDDVKSMDEVVDEVLDTFKNQPVGQSVDRSQYTKYRGENPLVAEKSSVSRTNKNTDNEPQERTKNITIDSPVVSNSSGCGKEYNDKVKIKGKPIKIFCTEGWLCPECQARDKK